MRCFSRNLFLICSFFFLISLFKNNFVLAEVVIDQKTTEEIGCEQRFNEKIKKYQPPSNCKTLCQKTDDYLATLREFLISEENRSNEEVGKFGCGEQINKVSDMLLFAREVYKKNNCAKTACRMINRTFPEVNPPGQLLDQARRGTFQVISSDGRGSSFFVGRSGEWCVFGTNAHVLTEDGELSKDIAIDFNFTGKISPSEKVDEKNICINKDFKKVSNSDIGANNDVALIKVKCDADGFFSDNLCPLEIVKWEKSLAATYVDVPTTCRHGMFAEGFPGGVYKFKNSCTCKGKCFANNTFFEIQGDILPKGSSGGPVFNRNGELCGFITQGEPNKDLPLEYHISRTSKSQAILDLMDKCGGDFKVKN